MRSSRNSWRSSDIRPRRFGSGWVLSLIVVIAVFFIEHRSTPVVAYPAHYTKVGTDIQIPVATTPPSQTGESWSLGKINNTSYIVTLTENSRTVREYRTKGTGKPTAGGVSYTTTGVINIEDTIYQATTIVVGPDGHSGYIELKPVKTVSENATSNAATGNRTSP